MVKIYNDDCMNRLDLIEEDSIESIITDPPYGLTSIVKRFGKENSAVAKYGRDGAFTRLSKGFMGKAWDGTGIEYNVAFWKKCLKVLKPGGYLLAFGGSRTFHRIAVAIEDAGFEIRDTIMWIYGSGFPKSMNIGVAIDKKNDVERKNVGLEMKKAQNKWNGWGTQLKPSYEPIIVARKMFKGTLLENVLENDIGGLNIDECRIYNNGELVDSHKTKGKPFMRNKDEYEQIDRKKVNQGRFPANTILTYDEVDYEEVCGGFPQTKGNGNIRHNKNNEKNYNCYSNYGDCDTKGYDDSGSASRYFYCAKASRKDRDEGLEIPMRNIHPTVKPTELMQYLVRLVTPKGGTVLDPFMGSGSTGKAVMYENKERGTDYSFIGIEQEKDYCDIAEARIKYVKS